MTTYICDVCKKKFRDKTNYTRHVNRKNKCIPPSITEYTCPYCNAEFTEKSNLSRHIKKYCTSEFKKLHDKYLEIKEENKKLKEELQNKNNLHGPAPTIKNINSNNGNIIESINGNNNNIVVNNNIILAFGKENKIASKDDYIMILNTGKKALCNYVKFIHFNSKKPENHNIYVSNLHDLYCNASDGNKFIIHKKDIMIDNLITDYYNILDEQYYKLINELNENSSKEYRNYCDDTGNKITDKEKREDIIGILYNNRHMPINRYRIIQAHKENDAFVPIKTNKIKYKKI
jgi:uncharacterized C2H2 Zn-finger protein